MLGTGCVNVDYSNSAGRGRIVLVLSSETGKDGKAQSCEGLVG